MTLGSLCELPGSFSGVVDRSGPVHDRADFPDVFALARLDRVVEEFLVFFRSLAEGVDVR